MAEPTSKFQEETLLYIRHAAPWAQETAKELGVSVEALIGAVANEFDTRHNPDLDFDKRGSTMQDIAKLLLGSVEVSCLI